MIKNPKPIMPQSPQLSSTTTHPKGASLQRLRKFSRLLDNAIGIPGTSFRVGLDPILGLIPVLGDLFDFAWKANTKNMALLEAHLQVPQTSQKANRWFIFLLLAGLFIFSVGVVSLSVLLIRLLVRLVSS